MALIADFVTGKPVSFRRVRHLLAQMGLQEGVVGAGDLKVAQRAAGANMSVDVAAGMAWVGIDTGVRNGIAHLLNDAVANIVVPASDASNPTVHLIVAQYNDTAIPAGAGGDDPTFRLIAGTPTAGATLDNRSGAPAMPADAVLLADVLVPAASTSVINANIRDRRRWAHGAQVVGTRTGGDYTTTSTTEIDVDSTLNTRMECSGVPLMVLLEGHASHNSGGNESVGVRLSGVAASDTGYIPCPVAGRSYLFTARWDLLPVAGSIVFAPKWRSSGGTSSAILRASVTQALRFVIREHVGQNAVNS